jgi:hypothetical protein
MVSFAVDFGESNVKAEHLEEERPLIMEIRSRLGACTAFVNQRWKEIQKDVDAFSTVIECPTCQQRALEVDDGTVKCRFCYHSSDSDDAANEYISRVLGYGSRYATEKDGGVWPLKTCPECGGDTLVRTAAAEKDQGYFCFHCGSTWKTGELVRCWECNELFVGVEEEDGNICIDCFRAKMGKD